MIQTAKKSIIQCPLAHPAAGCRFVFSAAATKRYGSKIERSGRHTTHYKSNLCHFTHVMDTPLAPSSHSIVHRLQIPSSAPSRRSLNRTKGE